MNKAELINAMAAESGLSKVDSKKALEAFFLRLQKLCRLVTKFPWLDLVHSL